MRFIQLIYANIRRLLAQPLNIILIIALPALILLFQNILLKGGSEVGQTVIINEDKGIYAEQMMENLDMGYTALPTLQEGLDKLETYESETVYHIPADYSEQLEAGHSPKIVRYSTQESTLYQALDNTINQAVLTQVQSKLFADAGIDGQVILDESTVTTGVTIADYAVSFDYLFSMLMIIYFILVFSTSTGTDLLELRTQKVTSRMFVTPNSSFELLAALSISYFLMTFLGYGIVVIFAKIIFNMDDMPLGMTLLIIALASLFALSMSLFLAKITKSKQVISIVPMLWGMLGFIGVVLSLTGSESVLTKLALISPMHWFGQMMMYGDILKNGAIILLMTLVLLTAGSYNFQKFVED